MNKHLSAEEIRNYLARSVTRRELDRVSDHVYTCATCHQVLLAELEKRFPIEFDLDELAGLQGWHLEGEELAAYIAGRVDDLHFECASLHLQECGLCMEKVSAAFEYPLEYPRLKRRANRKQSPTWNRHVPGAHSIYLPRLQLAGAAVVLAALALIMWALLQPKSENPQLATVPPSETFSPDPSSQQPTSVQPGPDAGSDAGHKIDRPLSKQIAATASSEKQEVGRQEDETDRALIARDLAMPTAIEMLDRTPAMAVRGTQAAIQYFSVVRPFTTLIDNERPTFCWTALSGATSYTVSVYDADLHLVKTSQPLTETQWRMSERLVAGTKYTWIVTALKDGQAIIAPALPARAEFKIFGKSELSKLNRMVSRTASHAARGVLYAKAGLLDEAEKEFQTHLTLFAVDERAKKLLQTVQSWRVVK
jgi:hypothetical protein